MSIVTKGLVEISFLKFNFGEKYYYYDDNGDHFPMRGRYRVVVRPLKGWLLQIVL